MRERLPNTPYRYCGRIDHGRGHTKRYAVIHSTESPPGSLRGVENFFRRSSPQTAGAQVIIDDNSVVQLTPLSSLVYHCPGGNSAGIGFELTGYADNRYSWKKRRRQRKLAANRVAWLCYVNGWGSPRRGKNVFAHGDFPPPNNHYDPGKHFPWALFMAAARRAYRKLQRTNGRSWA